MKDYKASFTQLISYAEVKNTALFNGINEKDFQFLQYCLGFRLQTYDKDQILHSAGDTLSEIGFLLSGSVSIENIDLEGKSNVLNIIGPKEIFGESYAALYPQTLLIDIRSLSKTRVLWMNIHRFLETCEHSCFSHHQLIQNLFAILARKNIHLSNKIFHSSPKTIRGKLELYFADQKRMHASSSFTIPFNRQQMADYLRVDRSALSAELGKMQKEGLIRFHKNQFTLLKENSS